MVKRRPWPEEQTISKSDDERREEKRVEWHCVMCVLRQTDRRKRRYRQHGMKRNSAPWCWHKHFVSWLKYTIFAPWFGPNLCEFSITMFPFWQWIISATYKIQFSCKNIMTFTCFITKTNCERHECERAYNWKQRLGMLLSSSSFYPSSAANAKRGKVANVVGESICQTL